MYVPSIPLRHVYHYRYEKKKLNQTINTNNKSSKINACWISKGTRSRLACLPLPFNFGTPGDDTTRELSGARTNDVSAMNEESFRPVCIHSQYTSQILSAKSSDAYF